MTDDSPQGPFRDVVPHLMAADAKRLHQMALQALFGNPNAQVTVSAQALASLVHQAHSPNLGIATTRVLRDELDARGPDSPDDYRTFDPSAA